MTGSPGGWWRAARSAAPLALGLCLLAMEPLWAHDLAETSATLIVRDGGHVELRLQVPWADVLRSRWMPGVPLREFLVRVASQGSREFARDLLQVEGEIERETRVAGEGGSAVHFVRWQWPSPSMVQEALRRELMSRLADGDRFEHASRLPASAEATLPGRSAASVRVRLPQVLGPALLTVSRPTEQWLGAGQWSTPVALRPPSPPR